MPTGSRINNESVISCNTNQEREIDEHHPYATLKPTTSKPPSQQQQFHHDHYVDHRQKMMPTMKYAPQTAAARKSAIPSPTMRHEEPMNFASGPKPHHLHHHHQESSYKMDSKVFTSNIEMSLRQEEAKEKIEHEPPLEGLAASLRQHVIASMKIKEENESSEPKYPYQQMSFSHVIKKECKVLL